MPRTVRLKLTSTPKSQQSSKQLQAVADRSSRWTLPQEKLIKNAIEEWHTFALDTHAQLLGEEKILRDWKVNKAMEIVDNVTFKNLPRKVTSIISLNLVLRLYIDD
jgi:hypothetical protein